MHKVVRGIDVFDVGKEQLWRWCGWCDYSMCEPTVNNNACSLRKGAYVVVGNMAKFGAMARMPYVWEDCTSLKAAVELVECFYESDFERYEMNLNLSTHIVDDYEIWHVVDDDVLWSQWCKRAKNALELSDKPVRVDKVRCIGPRNYHALSEDDFELFIFRYEDATEMLVGMGYKFSCIHPCRYREDVNYEIWTRYKVVSSYDINGLGVDLCEPEYMREMGCTVSPYDNTICRAATDECPF